MPVKKVQSLKLKVKSVKKAVTGSPLAIGKVKKANSKDPKTNSLTIPVYSLTGKTTTTLSLPKEIFGKEVSKKLLAQALRVYTTNKKIFTGATKGRGQVEGSTVKIWRQKGTGRARHGSVRAPIFVGGGIVFGPTPRSVRLNMPSKMKKAALFSALSAKTAESKVLGLTGLEKASGKTKEINGLLNKISGTNKKMKSALIVVDGKNGNVVRAVRNIDGVDVLSADLANAYEVLSHGMLLITKEAINAFSKPKEEKV